MSIESLDLRIDYDPAVLTFLDGRNGSALGGGAFPPTDPIVNDLGGTLAIAGTTLLVGVAPPEGGVLFELDFQIRGDAVPGAVTTQDVVEVRINESQMFTSLGATPNATPGTITVQASMPPPVFGVTVGKLDAAGNDLEVDWADMGCVGDLEHQIVWGLGAQLPASPGGTYVPGGAECAIGAAPPYAWVGSPDPSSDPRGLLWWVVVATDGAVAEGAWGPDGAGTERDGPGTGGASGQCVVLRKDLTNDCLP